MKGGRGGRSETTVVVLQTNEVKVHLKYHIILALDSSGSMSSNTSDGKRTRWEATKNSAEHLIHSRIEKGSHDLFSIVLFDGEAHTICESQPLWKKQFVPQFQHFGGGTHFGKAINCCHSLISKHSKEHQKRIPVLVFLSDGQDSTGESELAQLKKEFGKLRVFVVGFCSDGEAMLKRLAASAKGKFLSSTEEITLKKAFSKISEQLLIVSSHSN